MKAVSIPGIASALSFCLLAGAPPATLAQSADSGQLAEVLVTASKRGTQTVLNTPMAIQAITATQLKAQNINEFQDYARTISGLSYEDQGPGDKKIVIRGLDSSGASTTGLYFDDIVITGNNSEDGGGREPDIHLVDMERIEVLKGPQGTLYGASSMSGTVRMITNKPDPTGIYAAADAGGGSTQGANGANYDADGTVNVPLVQDKLALRVVGYQSEQRGYINDILLGINGVNNESVAGGRAALRWLMTDSMKLDLMFIHQTTNTIGPAWSQPQFGRYVEANNSTSPWSESLDAYNMAYNWDVAHGVVTATLSKMIRNIGYQYPGARILCTLFGGAQDTCFGFDNSTLASWRSNDFEPQSRAITSSELRYGSEWRGPVQAVGGLFYEDEDNNFLSQVFILDPQMMPIPTLADTYNNRSVHNTVLQKAAFGEVNYNIVGGLTLTGGLRVFQFVVGQRSQNLPDYARPVAAPLVFTQSTESSSTYKANLQYKFAGDRQLYFTFAQGFRSGGNNEPDFTTGTVLPPYKSDSLDSYELGGKGRFLGGALELDAATYLMEWKDLQQRISAGIPGSSVQMIANVGQAQITGAELNMEARPFRGFGLLVGTNATVLRDVITKAAPGINSVGDRVPNVPEFTANVYSEYMFSLGSWNSSARAEYEHVGASYASFDATRPIYTRQGDYSLVNLRLNFERGSYRFGAYVTNLFNTYGIITASIDTRTPLETFTTQPRTVGVTVGYTFD